MSYETPVASLRHPYRLRKTSVRNEAQAITSRQRQRSDSDPSCTCLSFSSFAQLTDLYHHVARQPLHGIRDCTILSALPGPSLPTRHSSQQVLERALPVTLGSLGLSSHSADVRTETRSRNEVRSFRMVSDEKIMPYICRLGIVQSSYTSE